MPLSPGDKLGPYEILAPLGEGSMGEVYKARDTCLDRSVAIKTSKSEFTERFEREARAVAALNHPNICQLYDVGPNYLVMELIEGTPLKGPLPLDKAIEAASQILDALDAAYLRQTSNNRPELPFQMVKDYLWKPSSRSTRLAEWCRLRKFKKNSISNPATDN